MTIKIPTYSQVLSFVGILGVVFYMLSPIFFPEIASLRQPELLPVFTLMMGLGQLLKDSKVTIITKREKNDEENTS